MGNKLEPANKVASVNAGSLYVEAGWTGCYGPDDDVGGKSVEIAADAIAPHAAGHKPDIAALGALEQINQQVAKNAPANGGVRDEAGSANRKNRDLLRCLNAATFPMEVASAGEIMVKGNFCQDVRANVGRSRNRSGISLRSKLGAESKWERDLATRKLLGILDGYRPDPVIIKVVGCAEFTGARVVVTHAYTCVLLVTQRQVGGIRRDSDPVRRLQSPRLSTQEFPFAPLQVQPVQPDAVRMAVGRDEHVRRIVAVEVKLHVPGHVVLAEL